MPALRPRPRRSARLQALTNTLPSTRVMAGRGNNERLLSKGVPSVPPPAPQVPQTMPATRGTATQRKRRGRGGKSSAISQPLAPPSMQVQGPSDAANTLGPPPGRSSGLNINWDPHRIQTLISWITTYPADRHVLCHDGSRTSKSQSSAPKLPSGEKAKPSGKTKKDVAMVIAKHMFENDPLHAPLFLEDTPKYAKSIINRLATLKSRYRECRARFKSTGGGIIPSGDDGAPQNLLEEVLEEFPYYQDLDAIWSGIPSFDCELVSSDPSINNVGSLVGVVKSKSIHTIHTVLEEEPEQEDDEAGPEFAAVWGLQDDDVHMDDAADDGFAASGSGLYDDPPMTFDSEPSAQPTSMFEYRKAPSPQSSRFSAAMKGKTPAREGRNAFTKPTPYSRPPSSSHSVASMRSSWSDGAMSTASTKKTAMSSGSKHSLGAKFDELEKASGALEGVHAGSSRAALKYNYALRKRELDIQQAVINDKATNAKSYFEQQYQLKVLELKVKEVEQQMFTSEIDLLNKRLEYTRAMKEMGMPVANMDHGLGPGPGPFSGLSQQSGIPAGHTAPVSLAPPSSQALGLHPSYLGPPPSPPFPHSGSE